jgi:hypothetical protein
MFGHPGPREDVHERDAEVHESAEVRVRQSRENRILTYTWGDGPDTVLLVHGWGSRASALSALVPALLRAGRRIVAFDAPAHGDSSGTTVTALDFADAVDALFARYGPFEAIVAHSFGVLGSFRAVRRGVRTNRIVAIAGVHSGARLVGAYAAQIGLEAGDLPALRDALAAGVFRAVEDPWRTLVSEAGPGSDGIPLLVVSDRHDTVVDSGESERIASAHAGPTARMTTQGLGHKRILRDPAVLAAVAAFVGGEHVIEGTTT